MISADNTQSAREPAHPIRQDRRRAPLRSRSFSIQFSAPLLAFVVLLAVTHFVAQQLNARMQEAAQLRFSRFAAETSNSVAGQLTRYVDILPGLRGLWDSDGFPTRRQFSDYVGALQLRERFPSLLYANYADAVDTDKTAAYEAAVRNREGMPGFAVYPQKTPHAKRLVFLYGYPPAPAYYGRDMMVNFAPGSPIYQGNIDAVQPFASGIAVPKEGDEQGPALGFRLAVYRGGGAPAPNERATLILGSVGIFVDMVALIREAVQSSDWDYLSLSMRSLPNPDDLTVGERRLFDFTAPSAQTLPQLTQTTRFRLAKRTFELSMRAPLARFEDPIASYIQTIVYSVGLLLAFVTSAAIYLLLRSRMQLIHTVIKQSTTLESTRERLGDLLERQLHAEREIARQAEQERQRIGKELHDDLGQRLTGASLMLRTLQHTQDAASHARDAHGIEHVASIVEGGIDTIRMLARGLSPFDGREGNLAVALKQLCGEIHRLLPRGCTADIQFDTELLSADESLHLFRIAQESISNALRHAAPTCIAVRLLDINGRPRLEIEDDGIGLPAEGTTLLSDEAKTTPHGLGLRSIRSRAHMIGLTVQIVSTPTDGTLVRIGPL